MTRNERTTVENRKKYYHMIVGKEYEEYMGDTSTRREYISVHQGDAPAGWVCVGVCGYHEKSEA